MSKCKLSLLLGSMQWGIKDHLFFPSLVSSAHPPPHFFSFVNITRGYFSTDFVFRESGGKEEGRETSIGCCLHAPRWGANTLTTDPHQPGRAILSPLPYPETGAIAKLCYISHNQELKSCLNEKHFLGLKKDCSFCLPQWNKGNVKIYAEYSLKNEPGCLRT